MINSLKKLEKNLGLKLQNNVFCLAIDTATTSGICSCLIYGNNVKLHAHILKIPSVSKDIENKSDRYEEALDSLLCQIREFKDKLVNNYLPYKFPKGDGFKKLLVLENSFLSFNAWTYGYLKGFMGILYSEFYDLFDEIKIIFPTTARREVGFVSQLPKKSKSKEKKKEIMKWISNVVEESITDDNCADAILLALAGLKQ